MRDLLTTLVSFNKYGITIGIILHKNGLRKSSSIIQLTNHAVGTSSSGNSWRTFLSFPRLESMSLPPNPSKPAVEVCPVPSNDLNSLKVCPVSCCDSLVKDPLRKKLCEEGAAQTSTGILDMSDSLSFAPDTGKFDETLTMDQLRAHTQRKVERDKFSRFLFDGKNPSPKRQKLIPKPSILNLSSNHQSSSVPINVQFEELLKSRILEKPPVVDFSEERAKLEEWGRFYNAMPHVPSVAGNVDPLEHLWLQTESSREEVSHDHTPPSEFSNLIRNHAMLNPQFQPSPIETVLEQQKIKIRIPKASLPPEVLHNLGKPKARPTNLYIETQFTPSDFVYSPTDTGIPLISSAIFDSVPEKTRRLHVWSSLQPMYSFEEATQAVVESLEGLSADTMFCSALPVMFQGSVSAIPRVSNWLKSSLFDDGFDSPPNDFVSTSRNTSSKSIAGSFHEDRASSTPVTLSVLNATSESHQGPLSVKSVLKRCQKVWLTIIRKDFGKEYKKHQIRIVNCLAHYRRIGLIVCREIKKKALRNIKTVRDLSLRYKKVAREVQTHWRKSERDIVEQEKQVEKLIAEKQKREEDAREEARQKKKLEFLLSQTELFSHFIGNKMGVSTEKVAVSSEDHSEVRAEAAEAALAIIKQHRQDTLENDMKYNSLSSKNSMDIDTTELENLDDVDLLNPSTMPEKAMVAEPTLFNGKLKSYQLKGLNWLVNLYDQGINGILADEMGLGKTIQSISFMSYLAEVHNIWGPFLIVSPNSTLHQWVAEINRFCPSFKVIPYWGDVKSRKTLRKFWNPKELYKEDGLFHCCVTSYAMFVGDEKYFSKLHWQYVILDEAQQIKNASSMRWKALLNIKCRNRLLLTGTPIQNSMAELWALLHFIMPSIFDSHTEFNDWFSKDIESHASGNQGNLDAHQLQRLHMILKPFMLRRVKSDVEHEMAPKIEIQVNCELSSRQKEMYSALRDKVFDSELLNLDSNDSESLLNVVMQFRKVCNHPEIFERSFSKSPFVFSDIANLPTSKIQKARDSAFSGHYISASPNNPILFHEPVLVEAENIRDPIDLIRRKRNLIENELNIWHQSDIYESFSTNRSSRQWMQHLGSASDLSFEYWSQKSCPLSYLLYKQDQAEKDYRIRLSEPFKLTLTDAVMNPIYTRRFTKTAGDRLIDFRGILRQVKCYIPRALASPIEVRVDSKPLSKRLRLSIDGDWEKQLLFQTSSSTCFSEERLLCYNLPTGIPKHASYLHGPMKALPLMQSICIEERVSSNSSMIKVPDISRLLVDSGKLTALHALLLKLKAAGHRVLIFSQMVRMIDILEEYMNHSGFKMFRLDGSTDVFARRKMVKEFQENNQIFAFLLSTRAGGLGITLTAADTVIFFDNDWNPTMDAQAMDRVHRIGQTKQVVVYRLVCRGTIEEKILERAQEKHKIQKTVYSGGFKMQKAKEDTIRRSELKEMLM